MTLDELIERLEKMPQDAIPAIGFHDPHSYRGHYNELAFQPTKGVTFGEMLQEARTAKGNIYQGYKGGGFQMSGYTSCWLANWGDCGEGIGPVLLDLMELSARHKGEKE